MCFFQKSTVFIQHISNLNKGRMRGKGFFAQRISGSWGRFSSFFGNREYEDTMKKFI